MDNYIDILDNQHCDKKEIEKCAKKLMQTLHISASESIKLHLEKAYEIGYNDAIEEVKKTIKLNVSKK
ncbi:MAG: hypothetical protein LBD41_06865 [Clostridiales Family XIII bacterium]|jgi:hypothetical protein|nr:hypothetical protein [Clostridiales Family XIII bacterium]